jgi:hypothetical protein
MAVNRGTMSMKETSTTAVTPLLVLGDAGAEACADGFCALPAPEIGRAAPEIAREPGGTGE